MITEYSTQCIDTPIGIVEVRGNTNGVYTIRFSDAPVVPSDTAQNPETIRTCAKQLQQYFAGTRTSFDSLLLKYPATDFQRSVWDALMRVPYGETITYGRLAAQAGYTGAARAVGTAMNVNPLPIIIPCHRVVPSDGSVGDYAFGTERKAWLLSLENAPKYGRAAAIYTLPQDQKIRCTQE